MTATLHNIGTPRALGNLFGSKGVSYRNQYPPNTKAHSDFFTGWWNGKDNRDAGGLPIIAPDVPEDNSPSVA